MYFVCYLKSGEVLAFNCECTNVDCSNHGLCVFQESESGGALGIVPVENILYIERRGKSYRR